MNIHFLPNFLFLFYPLELILQANVYYHCNCYSRRHKWLFLNLKKKEKKELSDEDKNKIVEEINTIENFTNEFKCSIIISKENSDILEINDKINKENNDKINKNIDFKTKIIMDKEKSSSIGLDTIRKQLGI